MAIGKKVALVFILGASFGIAPAAAAVDPQCYETSELQLTITVPEPTYLTVLSYVAEDNYGYYDPLTNAQTGTGYPTYGASFALNGPLNETTLVSDENGVAFSSEVPTGDYTLTQPTPPQGPLPVPGTNPQSPAYLSPLDETDWEMTFTVPSPLASATTAGQSCTAWVLNPPVPILGRSSEAESSSPVYPTGPLPFPRDESGMYPYSFARDGGAFVCEQMPRVQDYGKASLTLNDDVLVRSVNLDSVPFTGDIDEIDVSSWEPGSTHTVKVSFDYTEEGSYSAAFSAKFGTTPTTVTATSASLPEAVCSSTPPTSTIPPSETNPTPSSTSTQKSQLGLANTGINNNLVWSTVALLGAGIAFALWSNRRVSK